MSHRDLGQADEQSRGLRNQFPCSPSIFFPDPDQYVEIVQRRDAFSFYQFPAELRNLIYRCYFEDDESVLVTRENNDLGSRLADPLFQVSRTVRYEALNIFFEVHDFEVLYLPDFLHLVDSLPSYCSSALTSIKICDPLFRSIWGTEFVATVLQRISCLPRLKRVILEIDHGENLPDDWYSHPEAYHRIVAATDMFGEPNMDALMQLRGDFHIHLLHDAVFLDMERCEYATRGNVSEMYDEVKEIGTMNYRKVTGIKPSVRAEIATDNRVIAEANQKSARDSNAEEESTWKYWLPESEAAEIVRRYLRKEPELERTRQAHSYSKKSFIKQVKVVQKFMEWEEEHAYGDSVSDTESESYFESETEDGDESKESCIGQVEVAQKSIASEEAKARDDGMSDTLLESDYVSEPPNEDENAWDDIMSDAESESDFECVRRETIRVFPFAPHG